MTEARRFVIGQPLDQRIPLGAGVALGEQLIVRRFTGDPPDADLIAHQADDFRKADVPERQAAAADDQVGWERDFGLDARTSELWLGRARSGGSWSRFDGPTFVVSLPVTPQRAAAAIARLFESEDESLPYLARALTALKIGGEEAVLAFAPGDDGWIRFAFDFEKREAIPVAEIIAERDLIAATPLADEIVRLLALE